MAPKNDDDSGFDAFDTLAAMKGPNPCWFHPFLGWLWAGLVGAYVELGGHYPWWAVVSVGVITSPVAYVVGRRLVRGEEQVFEAPREQAGPVAFAAWLVMTGWAAWSASHHVLVPPSWPAIGVLTFATVLVGVFYTHVRCTLVEAHYFLDIQEAAAAQAETEAPMAASATSAPQVPPTPLTTAVLVIFREAGFGACSVIAHTEKKFGPEMTLQLDPNRSQQFATVKSSKDKIVGLATRRLRALGIEIADDTIEFAKAGPADMVTLKFRLHKPPEVIPVRQHVGPGTINQPLWLGLWDDGEDIVVDIRYRHEKIIGGTDSGKTTLENMMLYGVTGTIDCIPWVCSLSKGLDLAGPWLQPLSDGRATQPVLDYVESQDWDAVERMLRVAYCTVRIRETAPRAQFQRDKNRILPSPDHPLIRLTIEESDVIMKDPRLIVMPDGRKLTAAAIILYLVSKGRQYAFQVTLLNQGVTRAQMGDLAGAIKLNVTRTFVFWTPKVANGQWALPDGSGLDTTKLPPHAFYMTNGKNAQPRQGKAAYIDEETAIPEAAIRHQTWMTTLEPYTQNKLREMVGDDYAGRWSYERTQIWRDYFGEFPHLPTPARETVATAGTRGGSPSPVSPSRKGTPVVRDGRPGWEYPGGFFVPDLSKSPTKGTPAGDDIDEELRDIPAEWRGAFDAIQGLAEVPEPERPVRPESPAQHPIPGLLQLLLVRLDGDERDFIAIDELAQLLAMDASELGSKLTELGVPSLRKGTNRTRGRSLCRIREVAVCYGKGEPIPPAAPDEE